MENAAAAARRRGMRNSRQSLFFFPPFPASPALYCQVEKDCLRRGWEGVSGGPFFPPRLFLCPFLFFRPPRRKLDIYWRRGRKRKGGAIICPGKASSEDEEETKARTISRERAGRNREEKKGAQMAHDQSFLFFFPVGTNECKCMP